VLFNSFEFLYVFLPLALIGFFVLGRRDGRLAAGWLTVASLAFYGWAAPRFVPLLVGSICFNFVMGRSIIRKKGDPAARRILVFAVAANLLVLAVFKYAKFFLTSVSLASGAALPVPEIVLPLGISFFTFTQIAFLVDAHRGLAREYSPVHYALFVTYFPHLIAGPIIHHGQVMPQFDRPGTYRIDADNLARGLGIFACGLAKKVLLADSFAPFAEQVFHLASGGKALSFFAAWTGVLAYTLQLYFDFSGYCDMAIGISVLFNITLPVNFNSPYKAANIIDFWRRWHMSLSRFLLDYLYIPLGGNRRGRARRYVNLMLTMLIGGLWHGANWTFVIWGGLHGLYLVVNHGWRSLVGETRLGVFRRSSLYVLAMRMLTFVCVILAWVFFRADSFSAAFRVLHGCFGGDGAQLIFPDAQLPFLSVGSVPAIAAGLAIVWFAPNLQEIFAEGDGSSVSRWARVRSSAVAGFVFGCLLCACIATFHKVSPFLYYQF